MESIYADGEAVFEAKSAFLCTASAAEVGEDHLRGGVRAHKVCQGQSRSSLAREGDVVKLGQTDAGLAAAVAGNTFTTRRRKLIARTETERLNILS